jgi:uncharacterized protein YkwD
MEKLQSRELMAADFATEIQPAVDISAEEQLMIELINRARSNPSAEAARYQIDLNQGLTGRDLIESSPKQPLAPVAALQVASARHATDMLMRDYFDHVAKDPAPQGKSPTDRAFSAGYDRGVGENLALWPLNGMSPEASVLGSHQLLFRSPGHRSNILGASYSQLGVGIEIGEYSGDFFRGSAHESMMTTEKFGLSNMSRPSITGVVYDDSRVSNDFYDMGEGVGGVTLTAVKSTGERYSTTTGVSGGYSLQVPAGEYEVYGSHGELGTRLMGLVNIQQQNVKFDVQKDQFSQAFQVDTNQDGELGPIDALLIINYLNREAGQMMNHMYPAHLDVNGDGRIEAQDALIVINDLNRRHIEQSKPANHEVEAQGEAEGTASGRDELMSTFVWNDIAKMTEDSLLICRVCEAV